MLSSGFILTSYAFVDRVQVMGANPEEMPLEDRGDRKWLKVCEDYRMASVRRTERNRRREDWAACEAEFEDALADWPWGEDVEQIDVRLHAARGGA